MTEAAFFDLDKTVIAKASVVAFGRPFYREGLISRDDVAFLGSESVLMAFHVPGYWSEGCTNAPGPIF